MNVFLQGEQILFWIDISFAEYSLLSLEKTKLVYITTFSVKFRSIIQVLAVPRENTACAQAYCISQYQ